MTKEEIARHEVKMRQDQISRWGPFEFLTDGYKERYYFWEAVVMYRKIIMTVLWTYSLSLSDPYIALMVGFFFVLMNLGLSTSLNPFEVDFVNKIEQWGLLAIAATFFLGLLLDDPEKATKLCKSGTQKTSTTGDLSCPPGFLCYNNAGQRYTGSLRPDSEQLFKETTTWMYPNGAPSLCGEDDARKVTFGYDSSACKCSPPDSSGIRWGDSFTTVNNMLSMTIVTINAVWLVCFAIIFLKLAARAYFNMLKRIPILGRCMVSIVEQERNDPFEVETRIDDKATRAAQKMLDEGWMTIVDKTTGRQMEFNPFTGEMREFLTTDERIVRDLNTKAEKMAEISSSDEEQESIAELTSGEDEDGILQERPNYKTLDFMKESTQEHRNSMKSTTVSLARDSKYSHNLSALLASEQPFSSLQEGVKDGENSQYEKARLRTLGGSKREPKEFEKGITKEGKEIHVFQLEEMEEKKQYLTSVVEGVESNAGESVIAGVQLVPGASKDWTSRDQMIEAKVSVADQRSTESESAGTIMEQKNDFYPNVLSVVDDFTNQVDEEDIDDFNSDESILFESSESSDADTVATSEEDWNYYDDSD